MAIIQEVEATIQSLPSTSRTILRLSQNENGRRLLFHMLGVTIPAGSSASVSGTKPDGVVYSKAGTIQGEYVVLEEDVQLTAVAGNWDAKIRIVNAGHQIASALLTFSIEKDPVDSGAIPSDSQLDGIIAEVQAYVEEARSLAYGSPLTATTAAGMTDTSKVYVYTGSETGMVNGDWYYYDGTAWQDGGVYNATAFNTDDSLSVEGMAADAKAAGEKLAWQNGYHDELTAGTALQLLSNQYTPDKVPYVYRQAKGVRVEEDVVGGSVGWNQLVTNPTASKTVNGITFTVNADKSITINGTATAEAEFAYSRIDYLANHKYAILGIPSGASSSTYWLRALNGRNSGNNISTIANNDYWTTAIFVANGATVNNVVFRPNIIDLTLLLGSTLADYIYSLETATAGTGVAKLKEWGFFGKDYYSYSAGSLESVKVSAHVMRDSEENIIHTYPLDSSLTLRGIPKKDSNNNLYYDGDVYSADGTVQRKYGVYTFTGSETWAAWGQTYYTTCLPVNGNTNNQAAANLFNQVGLSSAANADMYSTDTNAMAVFNKNVYVGKTWYQTNVSKLTGTTVVFELATPTTETAEPFAKLQVCDPYGTEEYIDAGERDVAVPVGHDSKYYEDVAGKVNSIPALPTTAGNYRLKVTVSGGVPSYEWVSA